MRVPYTGCGRKRRAHSHRLLKTSFFAEGGEERLRGGKINGIGTKAYGEPNAAPILQTAV